MADNDVLIQIRADVADINAKLNDVKGYIGNVTDETKRLSDQSKSYLGQFRENWVAASATIVAAWVAVNKAAAYMDLGAHAQQVESSFKIMAESSDAAANDMIESMTKATRGTIAQTDLMQKSVKLMTLGYDPSQIERFSNVVITASQIAGTSSAEAYDNLADAIATRMPRSLIRMGAVTREQMVIVTAAIKAGADETALYELAMANLELKQKMLQGTADEATVAMQKFHAEVKEGKETLGKYTIEGVSYLWGFLKKLGGAAYDVAAGFAAIQAAPLIASAEQAKAAYEGLNEATDPAKRQAALTAMVNAQYLADQKMAQSMDLRTQARKMLGFADDEGADTSKRATADEIAGAKSIVDAQVAKLKAIADAAKGAKDITNAEMQENKRVYDMEVGDD